MRTLAPHVAALAALAVAVAVAGAVAGCNKVNPNFCEGVPDNNCRNSDAGTDAPKKCTASTDECVCLKPQGVCVECTDDEAQACAGVTPTCGDDNKCRACRADDECESLACLETGACANAANVIYAASTGVGNVGCGTSPGSPCSLMQAFLELTATRNIIRLAPATYNLGVTLTAGMLTPPSALIARGSTLVRGPGGPVIDVSSTSFKLVGGTLLGQGNNASGVTCVSGTLEVHQATIADMTFSAIRGEGCELVVSRSKLTTNSDGGINMIGTAKRVKITNNFIVANGRLNNSNASGGMTLLIEPAGSVVEFNTIADNHADTNGAGGVECTGAGFTGQHNLVTRNIGGTGLTTEVSGSCAITGYTTHTEPSSNVPGWAGTDDYHLTAGSPAMFRDATSCDGNTIDIDGDRRPENSLCDLGADEYVP